MIPVCIYGSHVEQAALNWSDSLEWSVLHGLGIAIGDYR